MSVIMLAVRHRDIRPVIDQGYAQRVLVKHNGRTVEAFPLMKGREGLLEIPHRCARFPRGQRDSARRRRDCRRLTANRWTRTCFDRAHGETGDLNDHGADTDVDFESLTMATNAEVLCPITYRDLVEPN
jgi:hypothetical protein